MLHKIQQLNLDNKIRSVAKQIFDILIKQQKINFQFIQQNQIKFVNTEQRLIKTQIQCQMLQKKFDQKFSTASLLISEMNQFKRVAEGNLITLTNSIYQIENNYQMNLDNDKEKQGSLGQVNMAIKKIENQMVSLRSDVKLNRQFVVKKLTQDTHKMNQELAAVKIDENKLQVQFQKIRKQIQFKQRQLDKSIEYIRKSQLNDKQVQKKLKLILDQLQLRPFHIQLDNVRKSLQDKIINQSSTLKQKLTKTQTTLQQHISTFTAFIQKNNISQSNTQTKLSKLQNQSNNHNTQLIKLLSSIEKLQNKSQENSDMIKNVILDVNNLFNSLENVKQKQKLFEEVEDRVNDIDNKMGILENNIDEMNGKIGKLEEEQGVLKKQQKQSKEKEELKQREQVKVEQVIKKQKEVIVVDTPKKQEVQQKRRGSRNFRLKQSQQLSSIPSKIEQSIKSLQTQIQNIKSLLIQQQSTFKTTISQLQTNNQTSSKSSFQLLNSSILKLNKKLTNCESKLQISFSQTSQIKQRFERIAEIVTKVDSVGDILAQIDNRVNQSEALSQSMTQKTQQINNMLVRTRSDFTIKVDNINKQITKLWGQNKEKQNIINQITSTIPVIIQVISIVIVKNLNEVTSKRISYLTKFSSILEGVLYSFQQKILDHDVLIYRGDHMPSTLLLSKSLQYLIDYMDQLRTTNKGIYIFGKQVYKNIYPKIENLVSETGRTRVRSVSKNRRSLH